MADRRRLMLAFCVLLLASGITAAPAGFEGMPASQDEPMVELRTATVEAADEPDKPPPVFSFTLPRFLKLWPLVSAPVPAELGDRLQQAATPAQASAVIGQLGYKHLVPEVHLKANGVRQIVYRLPPQAAGNRNIVLVSGQHLPTRFGEKLPTGVVAVVSHFPEETVGMLGPFLWASVDLVTRQLYGVNANVAYASLGYPDLLFGEVYIQDPFMGRRLPFRPTDQIGDFVGDQLMSGAIRNGTVYLYVDPKGDWRLVEYPDLPPEGDAAHMMWNFNPKEGAGMKRAFGVPIYLRQSQQREQNIAIKMPNKPQDNVGASVIFRTDTASGQSDLIALAAFLYLDNPDLLRDLLYSSPLPDGSLPDPDRLLLAAGDLHYVSNGKVSLLLGIDNDGADIGRGAAPRALDLRQVRNHTGFYLGISKQ